MLHEQSQFTSKFIPTSAHDILKQSDLMDCAIQASDRSQKKKSNFAGFSETDSRKIFMAHFAEKQLVRKDQFRGNLLGKFC